MKAEYYDSRHIIGMFLYVSKIIAERGQIRINFQILKSYTEEVLYY